MDNTKNQIFFNFSYFALRLLGKGLYSNHWSAISELVANGLDAGAKNIKLIFDLRNKNHATIEILDDGSGMDYQDLATKYALIGKDKRLDTDASEELKKKFMGRKGIGKLAALYLSKKYYIITKTVTGEEAWSLNAVNVSDTDIPHLNRVNLNELSVLSANEWSKVKTGTLILLTDVNLANFGVQSIEGLKARLADFYLLDAIGSSIEVAIIDSNKQDIVFNSVKKSIAFKNFCAFFNNTGIDYSNKLAKTVVINSDIPEISDKPRDVVLIDETSFDTVGERNFQKSDGAVVNLSYALTGWVGIHTSIRKDEALRNDSEFLKNKTYRPNQLRLYVRKKLAVENFLEYVKNTHALSNYIEGEISFDILDDNALDDIATSNRQGFLDDDERVVLLINLIKPIINRLIKERIRLADQVHQEKDEYDKKKDEEKRLAEESKRQEELKRKEEEQRRKQAELEKQKEEQRRQELEIEKQREEQLRKQAELEKQKEEQRRHQAEIEKQQEEQRRKEAEIKRELEERKRKIAELAKQQAETRRLQAELQKKEEEERRKNAEIRAELIKKDLGSEKKRNIFLVDAMGEDQIDFAKRLHMIRTNVSTMTSAIRNLTMKLQRQKLTEKGMLEGLENLSYLILRIKANIQYGAVALFNTKEENAHGDLFQFIREYCENIASHQYENIDIQIDDADSVYSIDFVPQDIAIILDNILSNSNKAHATVLEVVMRNGKDAATINFIDNGKGLTKSITDVNELFQFGKGFTMSGTGIGLFHVKDIIENRMHGTVSIDQSVKKGFCLSVRLKK